MQLCCYSFAFFISLIVYCVQLGQDKPAPPTGTVVNGSKPQSSLHECAYAVHNVTLECGLNCKKECGICDPEYDGCVGTKYCPIYCDDGLPCIHQAGVIRGNCKGLCGKKNVCIPLPPLVVSDNELQMHALTTLIYFGICISSLIMLYFGGSFSRTSVKNFWTSSFSGFDGIHQFYFKAGLLYFIISGSFLLAAVTNREKSLYLARLITTSVLDSLGFMFILTVSLAMPLSGVDPKKRWLFLGMWFMVFYIDISSSAVGNGQAVLKAIDELHIGIPEEVRCTHSEFVTYVAWSCAFGLGTYVFSNLSLYFEKKGISVYGIFFFTLGIHSLIMWLVSVSFYTACNNVGHKMFVPFGVTTCAIFFFFTVPCLYHIFQGSRVPQADLTDLELAKESDKSQVSNEEITGDLNKKQEHTVSELMSGAHNAGLALFRWLNPNMLMLAWFVGEFMVICWTMYIVKNEVKNENPKHDYHGQY